MEIFISKIDDEFGDENGFRDYPENQYCIKHAFLTHITDIELLTYDTDDGYRQQKE